MAVTVPPRAALAPEQTWNAASVFPDLAALEAEMAALLAELPALSRHQGQLGADPKQLADVLDAWFALRGRADRVFAYCALDYFTDTTNTAAGQRWGRAQGLQSQLLAASAFIEPELLAPVSYTHLTLPTNREV